MHSKCEVEEQAHYSGCAGANSSRGCACSKDGDFADNGAGMWRYSVMETPECFSIWAFVQNYEKTDVQDIFLSSRLSPNFMYVGFRCIDKQHVVITQIVSTISFWTLGNYLL